MKNICLNIDKVAKFVSKEGIAAYEPQVKAAMKTLEEGTGLGNDFLGWLHLPSTISKEHLDDLKATAQVLRENCEVVIVAGIGGSYLGARAVNEALSNSFQWLQTNHNGPVMIHAGHNISEDYLYELTEYLKDKKFGIINISKSGTTTETALAFRLLKEQCERQRGKEMARKVIVAITDAKKGAARVTADKEGYKSFIIPDNVGGRFSVLTPVGLLPIATAGYDIEKLVEGAASMEKLTASDVPFMENPSAVYAAVRNALYAQNGKKIEILVNYHRSCTMSANGGSSFTASRKARTTKESSPQPWTSRPTFTPWANGFRKVSASSSKRSSPSSNRHAISKSRATPRTWTA